MNPEIKKLWVEALRSGKYNQGQGGLCTTTPQGPVFCCLGVLCDIHKNTVAQVENWEGNGVQKHYLNAIDLLPKKVVEWAGLEKNVGAFGFGTERDIFSETFDIIARIGNYTSVATANDSDVSFKDIADEIERVL